MENKLTFLMNLLTRVNESGFASDVDVQQIKAAIEIAITAENKNLQDDSQIPLDFEGAPV